MITLIQIQFQDLRGKYNVNYIKIKWIENTKNKH